MTKTPVMVLQEAMLKIGIIPQYEEISCNTRLNEKNFTIRVKCKDYSANGTGLKKQHAKQDAAMNMITLLIKSKEITENVLSELPVANSPAHCVETINSNCSTSKSVSPLHSQSTVVNYVGKLNEYCAGKYLPTPVYQTVNIIGEAHTPQFLLSCTVSTTCGEAYGTTKKNAKQNAAKKVLQQLLGDINFIEYIEQPCNRKEQGDLSDLGAKLTTLAISKPETFNYSETEQAKERYRQKMTIYTVNQTNLPIEKYHVAIKNLLSNVLLGERDCLMEVNNNERYHLYDVEKLKNIILCAFKEKLVEINFYTTDKSHFVIAFRLLTKPVLLQIGVGETKETAQKQALLKYLEFIAILMK